MTKNFNDKDFEEALAEQPARQEPVAEVKAKMTGGNVGIATVIHEIYSPMRHPLVPGDLLYACPVNQAPVGWMHSRTGLFYSLSVKPYESGLLDEPTDKALPVYTSPQPQRKPLTPEWYAQWIRNNYQDYWNIATLCDEMTKAAHGIKENT